MWPKSSTILRVFIPLSFLKDEKNKKMKELEGVRRRRRRRKTRSALLFKLRNYGSGLPAGSMHVTNTASAMAKQAVCWVDTFVRQLDGRTYSSGSQKAREIVMEFEIRKQYTKTKFTKPFEIFHSISDLR